MSVTNFVLSPFGREGREIDLIGYSLEMTARALQYFAETGDLKKTRKKYCTSKKIPNNLAQLRSLVFPIETHGY